MPGKCFCHLGWSQCNVVAWKPCHLPQPWRGQVTSVFFPLAVLKAKMVHHVLSLWALHWRCHLNLRAVCWGLGLLWKLSHWSWLWQNKNSNRRSMETMAPRSSLAAPDSFQREKKKKARWPNWLEAHWVHFNVDYLWPRGGCVAF